MSRTITSKEFYAWKYPKREKGFAGYHFYLGFRGASEFFENLNAYQEKRTASERLIIQLKPVTSRVLKMVNCRSSAEKSFRTMILSFGKSEEFLENDESLELKLRDADFPMFLEALEATQNGIGDFNILDGRAWFWSALS